MRVITPSTRAHLRKLIDDRKAARLRYLDLCIQYQRSDQNSPEGHALWDACDAALVAWSETEERQDQAFIEAGIFKTPAGYTPRESHARDSHRSRRQGA
jgi:hypothetical protein